MPVPSLTWIGYNAVRLTAVIFLGWALAAQFIAISGDISGYSDALSIQAAASSDGTTTSSKTSLVPGITSSSSKNPYAAPSVKATSATTSAPIGGSTASHKRRGIPVLAEDVQSVKRDLKPIRKRENDDALQVGEGSWGMSSIPRQPGGLVFAILSRLLIASTLAALVLGQLAWPEMFVYQNLPWLGPQSTPIWLGLVQVVVAIENLRVYAKATTLLPSWGLLAIGLTNFTIGGVLLFLGRKLPKHPAPPLYFNLSVRPLYFLPPPKCYHEILHPSHSKRDPEHGMKNLPPSNSHSIGLDDENEDHDFDGDGDKYSIHSEDQLPIQAQHQKPKPSSHPGSEENVEKSYTDVRKGGYPTFSGGGMTDPMRQVPTGFIERTKDGRKIEFISEDGKSTKAPQPHRSNSPPTSYKHPKNEVKIDRKQLPPRGQSRTRALTADIPPSRFEERDKTQRARADSVDTLTLIARGKTLEESVICNSREANEMSNGREAQMGRSKTLSSMTFGPVSSHRTRESERPVPKIPLREKPERQSSASTISATREMGPRFPFPPSRKVVSIDGHATGDGATSPNKISVARGLVMEPKGPKPPLRSGSKRDQVRKADSTNALGVSQDRSMIKNVQQEDSNESKQVEFDRPETKKSSRKIHPSKGYKSGDVRNGKSPLILRSPETPAAVTPLRRSSSTESPRNRTTSSASSTSPKHKSSQRPRKRSATLAAPVPLQPSLSLKRSSSSRSTRGAKTARGVRFNLSPARESDEDSQWSDSEEGEVRELAPKGRISILSTAAQGVMTVGTPRSTMERPESFSIDDVSPDDFIYTTHSGSERNTVKNSHDLSTEDMKDLTDRGKRRGETGILGGGYLNGGKENAKI
ncbi:uncharacterized protein IL334_002790 [Kwoniella shivajii]|uniref:Uncharacterized protein n=1 Tax=Kwoniella shivajii TaxID=564305 RepID=A0ABZ1CXE3_9TREE|nr:hypothetical protein IL334_002790 [Kwoniella shivajii]